MSWEAASPETGKVVPAFVKVLGEVTDIVKDRTARLEGKDGKKGFQYTYADLASVLDQSRGLLLKHGLAVSQPPVSIGHDIGVRTIVLHESGEWLAFPAVTMPAGPTAQNKGSAITYARRYSLMAILGMATEDDDGANAGQRETPPQPRSEPAYSKQAHDMLAELRGYKDTPVADAVRAFAAGRGKGLSLADLDDPSWRFELANAIDEAKAAQEAAQ